MQSEIMLIVFRVHIPGYAARLRTEYILNMEKVIMFLIPLQ